MTKTKPLQLFVRYAALSCNLHNKYIQKATLRPQVERALNGKQGPGDYKGSGCGSGRVRACNIKLAAAT